MLNLAEFLFRGVALLLTMLPLVGLAQDKAAELRSATGTVYAQSSGGQINIVQKGAAFQVGDTVVTDKGAFALVVFSDGSRMALRPESALKIQSFNYKPDDPKADLMSVELVQGWLRNVSGQIGKRGDNNAFKMKVSTSSVGIRGTDFAVRLCDDACVRQGAEGAEGVLPQSGRLGRLLSAEKQVLLSRGTQAPRMVDQEEILLLGDTVSTAEAPALLGLDDGTRLVLGPLSSVALRAEEDDKGRRVIRVDLLQGQIRLASAAAKTARLYGLLLQAGGNVGLRAGAAIDAVCDTPADSFAFACPKGQVMLRSGQADVLEPTAVKPLRLRQLQELGKDKTVGLNLPGADPLNPWATTHAAHVHWGFKTWADPHRSWGPVWSDFQRWTPLETSRVVGVAQVQVQAGTGPTLRSPMNLGSLTDPLEIPSDAIRPPSTAAPPEKGVYTAVFDGMVSVATPAGQILVAASQAAYTSLQGVTPPRLLPAAPAFMERDKELQKSKLNPNQCVK